MITLYKQTIIKKSSTSDCIKFRMNSLRLRQHRHSKKQKVNLKRYIKVAIASIAVLYLISVFSPSEYVSKDDLNELTNAIDYLIGDGVLTSTASTSTPISSDSARRSSNNNDISETSTSSNNDDFVEGMKLLKTMKSEKKLAAKKKKTKQKTENHHGNTEQHKLSSTSAQSTLSSSTSYQLDNEGNIHNFVPSSKFAYVFLIAGCDPKDPSYMGYIYSVAVAKELLQHFGSSQDVIVMVRMHTKTNHTKLPIEQEHILTKLGINVIYIPKPKTDNFHTAMMDKFRILQLIDYERILYLDADMIPLNDLDYMFRLSFGPNAKLEENTVMMYYNEPANGGMFMLRPDAKDYQQIMQIIDKVEDKGYDFDQTVGWGHEIIPPDRWVSMRSEKKGINGTKWDFYGAFTDQGLLYHWTKYVKQKVSIIARETVQTWRTNEDDGQVQMIKERPNDEVFGHVPPNEYSIKPVHSTGDKKILTLVPYRDFHHSKGKYKPWLYLHAHNPPKDVKDISEIKGGPIQLWYYMLRKINREYGFGIDTEHLTMKRPTLGIFPTNAMVMEVQEEKSKE